MKKYGLDKEDIDYDDPKIRRAFWRILDEIRDRCGFESSGDKVLIQFYPAKDGGEIFVTKLGLVGGGAEKAIAKSNRVGMLTTRRALYRFSDLDSTLLALGLIDVEGCERAPRVFFDDNGDYYIIAEERVGYLAKKDGVSRISEYGSELPTPLTPYVIEHAYEIDVEFLRKIR